jgi:hypothetical protein
MATQQEVRNFIKSNYNVDELDNGSFKTVFDLGGGRSQLVFLTVNEYNVQYQSPFASVDDVSAKQALEANSEFNLGIQLQGNYYMVVHMAPLADLDASEIGEGFEYVTNVADVLEKKLVGGDKF